MSTHIHTYTYIYTYMASVIKFRGQGSERVQSLDGFTEGGERDRMYLEP